MKRIYGMLHLAPDFVTDSVGRAIVEAHTYAKYNLYGVIVENYHGSKNAVEDVLIELSKLNITCSNGKKLEIGVNILPNEYREAFELASKYNASFIQLDHVAGRYQSRNGVTELDHEDYTKIRQQHPNIRVMGGVWPKYYHPLAGDTPVTETDGRTMRKQLVQDLRKGIQNADMIVVTGEGTGLPTSRSKIVTFRHDLNLIASMGDSSMRRSLIIGAGMNLGNISDLLYADGAIVGSFFKPSGDTMQMVSDERVKEFMTALQNDRIANYYNEKYL